MGEPETVAEPVRLADTEVGEETLGELDAEGVGRLSRTGR
jgi:hypothetical protein